MLVHKQDQQKAKGTKKKKYCVLVNIQKTGEYQTTITITNKIFVFLMTSKEKKD
jgi:hypothetical protein